MRDLGNANVPSNDNAILKSRQEATDRFGIRTALVVMCAGSFVAALWLMLMSTPGVQKCSAIENGKDRITCYENPRSGLLTLPIK
jgi:hypothetical protein